MTPFPCCRLKRWGLNCYMYAPKDELKHRLLWREPYTQHEAAQMQSLIKTAQEHGVEFIFAISAGQDIVFSSAGDRLLLQQKLRQVAALGCGAFALLFDDIDPCLCRADTDVFPSLAQAQASVANEAYRELGLPATFLFCPTEYCSSLCSPSPAQSRYLQTLGRELLPEIGVIWTGPKVVSQELSVALVEEVEHVLQRRLLIWDNLFANDYDCRRIFLGPYTGRAPGLMPRLCGLLLNPNCELQANFIPIHTLGTWFHSELQGCACTDSTGTEVSAELGDGQGLQEGYSPQEALELALLDWVAEIKQQVLEAGGRTPLQSSTGCEEEAGLHPGTAGGQEALLGPQPCDTAPSGADQHEPEPCDVTPGNRKRKATSVPEEGNGSRASTGGPWSPAEDRGRLASGSRASCEPSSALPITAGSDRSAGAPVADETLHSLGTAVCCSSRASTCQSAPLDSGDVRERGSSPPGSPQPGASTADVLQIPSGSRADPSPGPISQLVDGATTSPVPTALLANGTAISPVPSVPLISEEAGSDSGAPLTVEEVWMLVELFYLPYHHGPQAQHLLEDLRWLRANGPSMGVPSRSPDSCVVAQWRSRARSFGQLCAQVCCLHSRFVRSAGQALLYDLHPYLWDIRNLLLAASAFVLWLDGRLLCDPEHKGTWGSCFSWCQSITAPLFPGEDAEPWVRRGGLFGDLQALLPVGNSCDLFCHPPPLFPSRQLYLLRPLLPQDKGKLYQMFREGLDGEPSTVEVLASHPDLLGDRVLGSFLSLSPEYTFVLEDEGGPCGYAAGALCAERFLQERDSSWLPAMQRRYPRELGVLGQGVLEEALLFFHTKPVAVPLPVLRRFPSLVQLDTAPRVQDVGASRSLAVSLLSALRANGSRGVFCQVSAADHRQLSFYSKLGFVALPLPCPSSPGTQLLGRLL
ncbi:protein O-GlcNAcase-like isoform X1 [Lagopus muta]|uniref:protein O-GlcNAcase-like isoform X1 n=1 Tax=Lagopus muta TaxID=64668 RepID=UPI00209F1795|nr:protein O-GlcNAcase-like isoform X1 [Lagopus muta]XP_048799423.1 protein O-GlcNAcase-like isoform X1 [Lagopus muta]